MAERMPPNFPSNTLHVQRALTAASLISPEKLGDAIAALYHQAFVENRTLQKLEDVWPIFIDVFGEETAKMILEKVK